MNIKDPTDHVWQLYILLKGIVEIVCAPCFTREMVAVMDMLIQEYLQLRLLYFPVTSLKPKHHFLAHYPYLTLYFGPLIRMRTMRIKAFVFQTGGAACTKL